MMDIMFEDKIIDTNETRKQLILLYLKQHNIKTTISDKHVSHRGNRSWVVLGDKLYLMRINKLYGCRKRISMVSEEKFSSYENDVPYKLLNNSVVVSEKWRESVEKQKQRGRDMQYLKRNAVEGDTFQLNIYQYRERKYEKHIFKFVKWLVGNVFIADDVTTGTKECRCYTFKIDFQQTVKNVKRRVRLNKISK